MLEDVREMTRLMAHWYDHAARNRAPTHIMCLYIDAVLVLSTLTGVLAQNRQS